MIIECQSCQARYVVPVSAFAAGGRKVRCARCKNEWTALPNKIDIFAPLSDVPTQIAQSHNISAPPIPPALDEAPTGGANPDNLPAVVKKFDAALILAKIKYAIANLRKEITSDEVKEVIAEINWRKVALYLCIASALSFLLIIWPIMDRENIVKAIPATEDMYEVLGYDIPRSGKGLIFNDVKSEIKYDAGTMRLYVDGVIHNKMGDTQLLPDIKAHALGPDRQIIESWWVPAPAASVAAGSDVTFHTEIDTPMQHTIDSVTLEFTSQKE